MVLSTLDLTVGHRPREGARRIVTRVRRLRRNSSRCAWLRLIWLIWLERPTFTGSMAASRSANLTRVMLVYENGPAFQPGSVLKITVLFGVNRTEHEDIRVQNLIFALLELRRATDPDLQ